MSSTYRVHTGGRRYKRFATLKEAQQFTDWAISEHNLFLNIEEVREDCPEPGKQYALTGATGTKCIANGNTWAESEVK